MSYLKNNQLMCVLFTLTLLGGCDSGDDSESVAAVEPPSVPVLATGKLTLVQNQVFSACVDLNGGKTSHFDPQTVLAHGGDPYGGSYKWHSDTVYGAFVGALTGVFDYPTLDPTSITLPKTAAGTTAEYLFNITVSDGGTQSATGQATLAVLTADSSPITEGGITIPGVGCPRVVLQQRGMNIQLPDWNSGDYIYAASLYVVGGTPPYIWSLDPGLGTDTLPPGFGLNKNNGVVYSDGAPWVSSTGKTYSFTVTVTDKTGETAVLKDRYSITINQ